GAGRSGGGRCRRSPGRGGYGGRSRRSSSRGGNGGRGRRHRSRRRRRREELRLAGWKLPGEVDEGVFEAASAEEGLDRGLDQAVEAGLRFGVAPRLHAMERGQDKVAELRRLIQ